MKNIFGIVLYRLNYTTSWTYDYNKVLSSYSYVSVMNGLGWSCKFTNSYVPGVNLFGKEHQWTGTANFAMIVGGIDVSNITYVNEHRVRHDGTYSWRYRQR